MRKKTFAIAAAVLMSAVLCSATTTPSTKKFTTSSPHKATRNSHGKKSRKSARSGKRGQQKIDSQRATQIQQALIREHYLSGASSGVWDSATQNAMQKYQADNGWQSKTTPDARALIKLGLGPDQQHLLNPESAMTSQPLPARGASASATSTGSANQPQK